MVQHWALVSEVNSSHILIMANAFSGPALQTHKCLQMQPLPLPNASYRLLKSSGEAIAGNQDEKTLPYVLLHYSPLHLFGDAHETL